MAKVLHVLVIEALGLHHYVAHLVDSISKYCKVEVLGYSRKYLKNIAFLSIFPEDLLGDKTRVQPLLLMFMSLFYTPLKLWHILQQRKYNIIHVQGHVPWLFLLFPYIRKKKIVLVWTLHDPIYRPSQTGIRGLLELFYVRLSCLPQLSMRHSNLIILHGKRLSKLLENWGVESQKIRILPHGNFAILAKTAKSQPSERNGLRDYVLFFGKIKPYKGIETLIHALPIIKKEIRNVLVVVAGFGKISQYLPLIRKEDRKNIRFLNYYIPDEEIPLLFQNAAFVILPYTEASQSGVLSLAYTFGKPVIASRAGAIDEYVDPSKTGFIFKPNDHKTLAKFVIKMFKDSKLRKTMELNCYKKAFSDLSWEKIARDTHEMYQKAVAHTADRRETF